MTVDTMTNICSYGFCKPDHTDCDEISETMDERVAQHLVCPSSQKIQKTSMPPARGDSYFMKDPTDFAETDAADNIAPDGFSLSLSMVNIEEKGESPEAEVSLSQQSSLKKTSKILNDLVSERQNKVLAAKDDSPHCFHYSHQFAWFTQAMFTLASLALVGFWAWQVDLEYYVGTFFVMMIAATAYFAKATGFGDIHVHGVRVPFVRYLDWLCTTPLMLFELCKIGNAEFHVTLMVIGCDILMLVFGIVGALIDRTKFRLKYIYFVTSCLLYAMMMITLHRDVANGSALDESDAVQTLYAQLEMLTVLVWSCYPFVVIMGAAHSNLISRAAEDALLCCLDMVAKIGMEGLIVYHVTFNIDH